MTNRIASPTRRKWILQYIIGMIYGSLEVFLIQVPVTIFRMYASLILFDGAWEDPVKTEMLVSEEVVISCQSEYNTDKIRQALSTETESRDLKWSLSLSF